MSSFILLLLWRVSSMPARLSVGLSKIQFQSSRLTPRWSQSRLPLEFMSEAGNIKIVDFAELLAGRAWLNPGTLVSIDAGEKWRS